MLTTAICPSIVNSPSVAKTSSNISFFSSEAEFNILFDHGIDDVQSIYDCLQSAGVIKKKAGAGGSIFNGEKQEVDLKLEFPTATWKQVYEENKEKIFDILDKLLIVEYRDASGIEFTEENLDKEELS